MILSILDFFTLNLFLDLEKFQNLCTFYVFQKMNVLPQFFYGMVVIGSLTMEGDGGGCGGCLEGVGRALGGRWRVVRVGPGSLIYRQITELR